MFLSVNSYTWNVFILRKFLQTDRSSAESLEPTLVQCLLDISTNGYRGDIKVWFVNAFCTLWIFLNFPFITRTHLWNNFTLLSQHRAIAILCQASFDKCRSLMENEVIPLPVKFVSEDYIQSVTEVIFTQLVIPFQKYECWCN